jgi:hypothetical protein
LLPGTGPGPAAPDHHAVAWLNGKKLSQKAQVAAIGNSVPPAFSEAVVRANKAALDYQPAKAATRGAPLFDGARIGAAN